MVSMTMSTPNQTSFKKGHITWNKGLKGDAVHSLVHAKRDCRRCRKEYTMHMMGQKYCSTKCAVLTKQCIVCGKDFHAYFPHLKYCSTACVGTDNETKRIGKNNPAYRDGHATKANNMGRSIYTAKHFGACKKYRAAFLEKHGYAFCEICERNEMATPKFEVHHIYFASLWPKHPSLHDFRNLVHVCVQCHNNFHAGKKYEVEFRKLEAERGLKELFGLINAKFPKSNLLPKSNPS